MNCFEKIDEVKAYIKELDAQQVQITAAVTNAQLAMHHFIRSQPRLSNSHLQVSLETSSLGEVSIVSGGQRIYIKANEIPSLIECLENFLKPIDDSELKIAKPFQNLIIDDPPEMPTKKRNRKTAETVEEVKQPGYPSIDEPIDDPIPDVPF
jgi:hypothetical protein